MLKPFTMKEAKPTVSRPRKGQQRSLWAVRTIQDRHDLPPPLKDLEESFVTIAPMWERKVATITMDDIKELKSATTRLATAIESRLSVYYRETKKSTLQHPSDVAAYLVLREVDEKACAEVPRLRLQALDFGVKALLDK